MKTIIKKEIWFERHDKYSVLKQLKDAKIRVKNICEKIGISRSYFYDMLSGRLPMKNELLNVFYELDIKFSFKGVEYDS